MPVQFDEQNFAQMQNSNFGQPKGLSAKLINWGIAKDQKSANVVLVISLLLFTILTVIVLISNNSSSSPYSDEVPSDQIIAQ